MQIAHGPATRHVSLSRLHAGQIVTPEIEAYHRGKGYVVCLRWYDAANQSLTEPIEFAGDFWACTRWLASHGVHADIDAA